MRVGLYARVSTKDKGQDHENQLRELRAFVERKSGEGWELAGEFVDKASAKTADRPAFKQLFAVASRKEFDMVLFWSLDRFSREGPRDAAAPAEAHRLRRGVVQLPRRVSPRSVGVFRDAVLAILACIAKQERIRLSERVQAGLSRARAQGKILGRPKAAVRVAHVLSLKAAGLTMREIAERTGVSPMTAQRILKAPHRPTPDRRFVVPSAALLPV